MCAFACNPSLNPVPLLRTLPPAPPLKPQHFFLSLNSQFKAANVRIAALESKLVKFDALESELKRVEGVLEGFGVQFDDSEGALSDLTVSEKEHQSKYITKGFFTNNKPSHTLTLSQFQTMKAATDDFKGAIGDMIEKRCVTSPASCELPPSPKRQRGHCQRFNLISCSSIS